MLQWVIGVCNKGWVMGGMGKWEGLYVGHWEGEVGVLIGEECVYEIVVIYV